MWYMQKVTSDFDPFNIDYYIFLWMFPLKGKLRSFKILIKAFFVFSQLFFFVFHYKYSTFIYECIHLSINNPLKFPLEVP